MGWEVMTMARAAVLSALPSMVLDLRRSWLRKWQELDDEKRAGLKQQMAANISREMSLYAQRRQMP